ELQNTGSITSVDMLLLAAPLNSGTITNLTGLHIEELTSGTNRRAIHYGHSTAPFVLTGDGNVGIGTPSPGVRLMVSGEARVTGNLTVGNYTLPTADGTAGQV